MAVSLYGAFFIVMLNAAADLIHAALDPHVRMSGSG
jgi:ABC-type dipeptide/oligopeptide/nickel transport system permease component